MGERLLGTEHTAASLVLAGDLSKPARQFVFGAVLQLHSRLAPAVKVPAATHAEWAVLLVLRHVLRLHRDVASGVATIERAHGAALLVRLDIFLGEPCFVLRGSQRVVHVASGLLTVGR